MGLIVTPEHERINTPEEMAFFDEIYAKYDRESMPATWDSRAKGFVSPVRNQGACGSCAAFALLEQPSLHCSNLEPLQQLWIWLNNGWLTANLKTAMDATELHFMAIKSIWPKKVNSCMKLSDHTWEKLSSNVPLDHTGVLDIRLQKPLHNGIQLMTRSWLMSWNLELLLSHSMPVILDLDTTNQESLIHATTTKLIMLSLLLDGVLKIIFHTG